MRQSRSVVVRIGSCFYRIGLSLGLCCGDYITNTKYNKCDHHGSTFVTHCWIHLIFPPNQLNVFVGRISIGFVLKIMKVSQQSTLKTHRSPAEWFNMRNQVESRGNKVAINSTCVTEDNWNQLNRIIIAKCVMDFPCLTCC